MDKYICKVLPTEECNEDFAPDKEMQDGVEVDGFMLVGFRKGKPYFSSMMGISVQSLADWLRKDDRGAANIRAACMIAEGERKAKEILEEAEDRGPEISGTLQLDREKASEILRKLFGGK